MKILILFCGGTLVMEENVEGALQTPTRTKAIKNLLRIEPKLEHISDLQVEYIANIDSTNINPVHWDLMADAIADNYDQHDGFVITHGTDTMAYTSSALSYVLQNIGKPVILTGAQIPGNKLETDARRNLINAVRVASMNISGVMIVFGEEIILGSRATKISESKLAAFTTINWDPLGRIDLQIRFSDDHRPRHSDKLIIQKGFETKIVIVTLVPGMPIEVLLCLLKSDIKGLIIRGHGPGHIGYEYLQAIIKANELNIPVVVTTQCREGSTLMHLYDVGTRALDLGVIQAYDMGIESLTTKFMWALKRTNDCQSIKEIIHTDYTGEINKERKIY